MKPSRKFLSSVIFLCMGASSAHASGVLTIGGSSSNSMDKQVRIFIKGKGKDSLIQGVEEEGRDKGRGVDRTLQGTP